MATHTTTPRSAAASHHSGAWSAAEWFAFRTVFAYFVMFGVASLLDVGQAPRRLLAGIMNPVVGWFGHTVMRLSGTPNDSGARWAIAQQIAALLVAIAVAGIWSAASRRTEYRRLHGWLRLTLRYYVGVIMLVYGAFKIFPTQFPPITLEQLSEPLGSLAPMGLLWSFMGYSTIYQMFTGFGEALGGVLLFFRKTTTAGALVLIAVLSNVALLNYTFDVPVKQLSSNLLLASVVLIAPDVRRLLNVLVFNHMAPAVDLSFALPRWLQRMRRFLKPAVVGVAVGGPLTASAIVSPRLRERAPLYGIYQVDQFVRNGITVLPVATDSTRWERVVFGRPRVMSTKVMSGRLRPFAITLDTASHRLTFWAPSTPLEKSQLEYERLANGSLRLHGVVRSDSVAMTLTRLDESKAFRLLR